MDPNAKQNCEDKTNQPWIEILETHNEAPHPPPIPFHHHKLKSHKNRESARPLERNTTSSREEDSNDNDGANDVERASPRAGFVLANAIPVQDVVASAEIINDQHKTLNEQNQVKCGRKYVVVLVALVASTVTAFIIAVAVLSLQGKMDMFRPSGSQESELKVITIAPTSAPPTLEPSSSVSHGVINTFPPVPEETVNMSLPSTPQPSTFATQEITSSLSTLPVPAKGNTPSQPTMQPSFRSSQVMAIPSSSPATSWYQPLSALTPAPGLMSGSGGWS